jgi:uncharacterized protein (DUF58 family)
MPAAEPEFLTASGLSRFKQLEILAQTVVEGFMNGQHKSPYKGFAIEFAEHREYVPGDDLKHLDWKLLGKQNRYYIKQYEEDTSLRCWLVLDSSGSMGYRSKRFSKFDYGRFICGLFGYLLLHQQDAVGLATFDSKVRTYLPPRSTSKHLKTMLDQLTATEPGEDTGLGPVLHSIAQRVKRRGLIVIISDFFDDPDDIILALNHFAYRKHEVIVFQVLDRREAEFSFTDMTRFESLEGGTHQLIDPIRVRRAYQARFQAHQHAIRQACHGLHIDFVQMFTDEPFDREIAKYLSRRLKR